MRQDRGEIYIYRERWRDEREKYGRRAEIRQRRNVWREGGRG